MLERPCILISNDDGIDAPGIAALVEALDDLGDCRVVAPDRPRSGVGHTYDDAEGMKLHERERGLAVDGTPADCARIALHAGTPLFRDWAEARHARAVWMVSGINEGANLGIDLYVSGTAAAAREAAILGFPAIAISQYVGRHRRLDWSRSVLRARPVLKQLLARPPAPRSFWNVNLPHPADDGIDAEVVVCPPDPSPHDVRYEEAEGTMHYAGDFHARPRLPDHDVAVCFGGQVALSEVTVHGLKGD